MNPWTCPVSRPIIRRDRRGCECRSVYGSVFFAPGPGLIILRQTFVRTGRRTMRAIGLVLLSIATMALLLTDADAKRRSSAQGSQAAGLARIANDAPCDSGHLCGA